MTKGTVGWREWVALPSLGIPAIKAKIDTGAKTSAIHAWKVHHFKNGGIEHLSFCLHPIQDDETEVSCMARLLDMREVTSSNGMRQRRFVIETDLQMGEAPDPIELTLTNRDDMGFRMLIGRQALRKRWLVDPAKSFLTRPDHDAEKDDE